MAKTHWDKFFWADWQADPAIHISSLAAQGLWMRMLCLAGQGGGYVKINGSAVQPEQLARLVGEPVELVAELLTELETNGVFSRDRHGTIYCRRMIRDAKKAKTARKNGKLGGNPSLSKEREIPASDNPPVEDSTYHKPLAKEEETPSGVSKKDAAKVVEPQPAERTEPKARAKTTRRKRLPAGWAEQIPQAQITAAIRHGLDPPAIDFYWGEFTRGALTHGRLYERWDLAWVTWMGNIEKYGGRKNGHRTGDSDTERDRQTRSDLADSVRAELEAERSGAG